MRQQVGVDLVREGGFAPWPVKMGGPEHLQLDRKFEFLDNLDESVRDRIFTTAADILGRCPDPVATVGRATGLTLGKVQSGKTSQFIALIALAIDNGYRLVVVIGGRDGTLLAQNETRLEEYLDLRERSDTIAGFVNPAPADQQELCAVLNSGRTALITVLKHQQRLSHLRVLMGSPDLAQHPTLIIDDEGDQASPNTKVYSGRKSAVYKAILGLRKVPTNHAYVAVTATPQANLLMQTWDELRPDFCVLVEPGPGYCGGSTFFRDRGDELLRIVPANEADPGGGVPPTLRDALALFVVGSAIRWLRNDRKFHSMLIHISNLQMVHADYYNAVNALIDGWRELLQLRTSDPAVEALMRTLMVAYEDLSVTVAECPAFDEVVAAVPREVRDLKVWMVNSRKDGSNPNTVPWRLKNNIFVGGNMLDRGVTLKGLAVTYITRSSGTVQADTLEQRARWFGYKSKYLDVCRVYATRELLDYFVELNDHEEFFWESLRRSEAQGIPLGDWPRLMKLGRDMLPTRSAVARIRDFKGSGWVVDTRPDRSVDKCAEHLDVLDRFLEPLTGHSKPYGTVLHTLYESVPIDQLVERLLVPLKTRTTTWDGPYIVEYLARLQMSGRLPSINVLLMARGEPRERTVGPDGEINPFQGPSPHRSRGEPDYYPGDRELHGGSPLLEINRVKYLPGGDTVGVVLALYIPPTPAYDIGRLVVPVAVPANGQ